MPGDLPSQGPHRKDLPARREGAEPPRVSGEQPPQRASQEGRPVRGRRPDGDHLPDEVDRQRLSQLRRDLQARGDELRAAEAEVWKARQSMIQLRRSSDQSLRCEAQAIWHDACANLATLRLSEQYPALRELFPLQVKQERAAFEEWLMHADLSDQGNVIKAALGINSLRGKTEELVRIVKNFAEIDALKIPYDRSIAEALRRAAHYNRSIGEHTNLTRSGHRDALSPITPEQIEEEALRRWRSGNRPDTHNT